jgi:hypothetical protein
VTVIRYTSQSLRAFWTASSFSGRMINDQFHLVTLLGDIKIVGPLAGTAPRRSVSLDATRTVPLSFPGNSSMLRRPDFGSPPCSGTLPCTVVTWGRRPGTLPEAALARLAQADHAAIRRC